MFTLYTCLHVHHTYITDYTTSLAAIVVCLLWAFRCRAACIYLLYFINYQSYIIVQDIEKIGKQQNTSNKHINRYVKAIGRYQGDEQTTCMCRQFKDTGGEQTTFTCRLLEDEAIWKYRPILYIYIYVRGLQ